MPEPSPDPAPPVTPGVDRAMAFGIAIVWLWTGLAVLHPSYMEIGGPYLDRLGLPRILAPLCCAGEVLLGLYVLLRPADRLTTWLQVGAVSFFTVALAIPEPLLLAHPFGVLAKNIPFCTLVGTRYLATRDGWTAAARKLLRFGVGIIWVTEGLLPKILFQQEWERQVVADSGLVPFDPGTFLIFMGAAQLLSGLVVLAGEGQVSRFVLACQAVALVVLPLLVAAQDPKLWVHPFGPLTKNVPILIGTGVLLCRPWSPSR
jgi:hypothetical protein